MSSLTNVDITQFAGLSQMMVCMGNEKIIEAMLEFGARIDITDANGNRPIHLAARCCNLAGITALIKHGETLSVKNRDGLTPVDIVMQYVRTNSFKTIESKVLDLIDVRKLPSYLHLDQRVIFNCAQEIFKFEILQNSEHSRLNEPEYLTDILPPLRRYINDCFAEVRLMKSTLLQENFPAFVMSGWLNTMPFTREYASEVVLNHILDVSVSTTEGYHIYYDEIISKLERPALCNKALSFKFYAKHNGKIVFLNSDAVSLIVKYLSNVDILNLLLAYYSPDSGTPNPL